MKNLILASMILGSLATRAYADDIGVCKDDADRKHALDVVTRKDVAKERYRKFLADQEAYIKKAQEDFKAKLKTEGGSLTSDENTAHYLALSDMGDEGRKSVTAVDKMSKQDSGSKDFETQKVLWDSLWNLASPPDFNYDTYKANNPKMVSKDIYISQQMQAQTAFARTETEVFENILNATLADCQAKAKADATGGVNKQNNGTNLERAGKVQLVTPKGHRTN